MAGTPRIRFGSFRDAGHQKREFLTPTKPLVPTWGSLLNPGDMEEGNPIITEIESSHLNQVGWVLKFGLYI